MLKKIEAKNEAWLEAVANACESVLGESVDTMSVREQLLAIFDPDYGEEHDEAFRKRLVKEYDLHVAIEKGDIPHLSATLKDSLLLCEEIFKLIPSNLNKSFDPQLIKKSTYGFAQRGEQAVFETFYNSNASFIELYVRTEAEACEDLLYWSANKLFLMHFVEEFDEEYAISTVGQSAIVFFKN